MNGYLDDWTLQYILRSLHISKEMVEECLASDERTRSSSSQEHALHKIQNGMLWAEKQLRKRGLEPVIWSKFAEERVNDAEHD